MDEKQSHAAAAARIAQTPPGLTLIDNLTDQQWHDGVEGAIEVGQPQKASQQMLTARRENGTHHDPDIAGTYGNLWVVRDASGNFVDWDRYSNDLRARYPNITFEGR